MYIRLLRSLIYITDECLGVPFSLGTFSWASKRKYLGPGGGETGKEF